MHRHSILRLHCKSQSFSVGCLFYALLLLQIAFHVGCQQGEAVGSRSAEASFNQACRTVVLGKVDNSLNASHEFAITNTSAKHFTILNFERSCSCQDVAVAAGAVIAPGSDLRVKVSMPSGSGGTQTAVVVVNTSSSDPLFKRISLSLQATFPSEIYTTPSSIELFHNNSGGASEQLLEIRSDRPGVLDTFRSVKISRGLVTASPESNTDISRVFRIAISPDAINEDAFDLVILEFDNPLKRVHTTRVRLHGASVNSRQPVIPTSSGQF